MPRPSRSQKSALARELKETASRLQEACLRLEEQLRIREEVLRQWEEEMASYFEERAKQQTVEHDLQSLRHMFREVSLRQPPAVVEAWIHYERQWQTLHSASFLTFGSIPWPVVNQVSLPESLVPSLISQFILSPEHSQTMSRKRRIHTALLRWHTDRFDANILHKVVVADRVAVRDGVGRVVRCLNEMLAAERA